MKAIVNHYSEFEKSEQKFVLMDLKKIPEIGDFIYIDEEDNYELYWHLCDRMTYTDDLVSPYWRIENYDETEIEGGAGYTIWVINENEF